MLQPSHSSFILTMLAYFRSYRRDEMILQGAFLIGVTSLALLIGQVVKHGESRELRKGKVHSKEVHQDPADVHLR